MSLYYLWHEGQIKTSNDWSEVLACHRAYVMSTSLGASSFGVVLPDYQWISLNKCDVPKEFKLGLMLLEVYI